MAISEPDSRSSSRSTTLQRGQERLVALDVVRVAVIVMVIAHHAAQPYGPTGRSPVTDAAQSDWFRPFYTVNAAFGLGLLFLLAGYFVPPAYDRKGSRRFLRERWSRLGVPLVAFVFAVNLPLTLAYEQPHSFGDFLVAWQSAVRSTLEGLVCVGLAVGLLVSAMAATSYGAYILHLYIVVPMQVAMTGPEVSPFLKFGVIAVLSVLLSFGAARLSRRVPGIRRVLGTAPPPAVTTADPPP